MGSALPAIIAANAAAAERERYKNDPVYRMAVLQDEERRVRKKIKHDIDRIHNPSWFACCRDHEKALGRHKMQLLEIKAAEAATRPLLPR